MIVFSSKDETSKFHLVLTSLHFAGALLIVVCNALFSAVESPLGKEISAGESAGFAWIRANITVCVGCGLVYLIVVIWIQLRQMRRYPFVFRRLSSFLICIHILGVAAAALSVFVRRAEFLALTSCILLISSLFQGVIVYLRSASPDFDHRSVVSEKTAVNDMFFLVLLFILGATISFINPSWHRLADQIVLDTRFESLLGYVYPAVLSGITSVWLGIGMLIIIVGIHRLCSKFYGYKGFHTVIFLTFLTLVAFFTGFLFITLHYAISWQIDNLHLKLTVWQLVVFLSVSGAVLFSCIFFEVIPHVPRTGKISMTGIVALTFGAAAIYPIIRLLTLRRTTSTTWVLILIGTIGACVYAGYGVLFGDVFNPWFTAFSYLKSAVLKTLSVIAAGTALLLAETLLSPKPVTASNRYRSTAALLITAALGFLPFYGLGKYPEVKAAVLQFNEFARVDATFARESADLLGFGSWMNLGQRPPRLSPHDPWPQPWKLSKIHPSLLPDGFNLLVIVVDALRGDAFQSAGYSRDPTPFLDRWAEDEAISFKRAYSQGGGSFAAIPFLVAGRSNFDLYGPGLYRQNLYFKIARAEGIQHYMLMKGFGPRHIYPPECAVTELTIPRAVSDRRSATADEVFQSARNAIAAIPAGERFLCFLQLMDVHNDLWKKENGRDFGDSPRDIYDNNLSYIDRAMERFMAWLKREGIYKKTVIVFLSDHGEQFWEHGASLHGHTVYEEEIKVPLILVSHSIRKRFEDVPVVIADVAPTLADLAGYTVEPPYDDSHMGISLVPLILGQERPRYLKRDVVGRASFKRRYFLYRDWEWKLVYFAELELMQLFNVVDDPGEKNNLVNERPVLAAEMERDLIDYLGKVEGRQYRARLSDLLKENGT